VLFGMDFQYMDAHDNYRSMDRMIDYFNAHYADKWLFQYSTPSHYVDAVAASNYTFTTKQDDLFPYGDTSPSWWTGYYTSRANAKAYVRRGSHTLRALNQLYSELALDQNADPDTLEAALTGSKKLLDAMGIFQHHDAVSGTARQDVADDYVYRLGEALEANMGTYGKIIDDMVSKLTQRTSDNTWEMCTRSNGTWVDCPVKDIMEGTRQMYVMLHNPSILEVTQASIKVPSGNFQMEFWSQRDFLFMPLAEYDVHCYNDTMNGGLRDCDLVFETQGALARTLNLYRITYNASIDKQAPQQDVKSGDAITAGNVELKIMDTDADSTLYNFAIKEGDAEPLSFNFGLRYWPSYVEYHDHQCSGAYAFRPIDHLGYSLPYTSIQSAYLSKGEHSSRFTIYLGEKNKKTGEMEKQAIVHISLDLALGVPKFDVDLGGLPNVHIDGYEVIVHFAAPDVQNEGVFYTDSNGLEMQRRELNYRSYYNITEHMYAANPQNITANYYPVNSAIAIRDEKKQLQFTLMNDRAQGGSSLTPGSLELMQNRRIAADDNKGVNEFLNETDSNGQGQRVPATYYVQLFNTSTGASKQRLIQMRTDDPNQFLFTKSMRIIPDIKPVERPPQPLHQFVGTPVKLSFQPLSAMKMLFRFENLYDSFDAHAMNQPMDMDYLVGLMWAQSNPKVPTPEYELIETSITGNMPKEEMEARRVQWKTTSKRAKKPSKDVSRTLVTVEP